MQRKFIPPIPQSQARITTTFCPPNLDGSMHFVEMFDWHVTHSSKHTAFLYSQRDGTLVTIMWPQLVAAVNRGSKLIRHQLHVQFNPALPAQVVGVLATSDTLTYAVTIMSIWRADLIVFPISPRNSALAIAHLVKKVNVQHLFIGKDPAMQNLGDSAMAVLKSRHSTFRVPTTSSMFSFEDIFMENSLIDEKDIPLVRRGSDEILFYMHTSGSTAFPKPIPWSQHQYVQCSTIPWFGEQDLTDQRLAAHSIVMYHGMGMTVLSWMMSCGVVPACFDPCFHSQLLTPNTVIEAARLSQSNIIMCVPSMLEAWAQDSATLNWLSSCKGVLFGGGPLNKEVGDKLVSQRVPIFSLYGSSECGVISNILPNQFNEDWQFFNLSGIVQVEMVPAGNGAFELVYVSNPFFTPCAINTQVNGVPAYATSDLLIPHPTKHGAWRLIGRADEQIMHSTGEKTNPGPLEAILNQDPHVDIALMFGRGHFQAGVLVQPSSAHTLDPKDELSLATYRNLIWPSIQKMNDYAPQHSCLSKEMILVASPDKPFAYTSKNTLKRQEILNNYDTEIELLYHKVDESTQSEIPPPVNWDIVSTTAFVRAVVHKVLPIPIQDTDNIFQNGCDSLQATWIRNSLLHVLRESAELNIPPASSNFVYSHYTISQLGVYLHGMASQGIYLPEKGKSEHVEHMHEMVEMYGQTFLPLKGLSRPWKSSKKVVMLIGSTGNLGAHILAALVADSHVHCIYAVNRKGKKDLRDRQKQAFASHGINVNTLLSKKIVLIELNFSDVKSQLESNLSKKQPVSHIIHNAWKVDFNLTLQSFESNIKALRHFLDYSLDKGARFVYISSIGVFQNISKDALLKEGFIDSNMAVGYGYSESKWVAERLVQLGSRAGMSSVVIRVGQLCGGKHGDWPVKEWFPAIIQSTPLVGCLPDDENGKLVSWIPSDICAQAVTETLDALDDIKLIHLTHPNPTLWSSLANIIASKLHIPIVPYSEWLSRLESLSTPGNREEEIPALRILPFYHTILEKTINGSHGTEAFGTPQVENLLSLVVSPAMREMKLSKLGDSHITKWFQYWNISGEIQSAEV